MKNVIPYLLGILLFIIGVSACSSTQEITSGTSFLPKKKTILIQDKSIIQDETYQKIKNNTARLHAMLSGAYVQYTIWEDSVKGEDARPWMVNDGKDSVFIYFLPAGDVNKVGHWLLCYQILTSLPDDPVFNILINLVEIDRDTTRAVYYNVPNNFDPTLEELLSNNSDVLNSIDFALLEESEEGNITYVRKTPLLFINDSGFTIHPKYPKEFFREIWEVSPTDHEYLSQYYDSTKVSLGGGPYRRRTKFVKRAGVKR